MDEFKYEDTYFFFVKGRPTACSAMYRRALAALAKETAREESRYSTDVYDLFNPPYLLACRQVNGCTMITVSGGFGEGYMQQLSADGIEGVEEFITIVYAPGAAYFSHDDNEGKVVKHLADFGLGHLSRFVVLIVQGSKDDVVRDFGNRKCDRCTERVIAIDYDTDLAPMLECDTLRYLRVQAQTLSAITCKLSGLRYGSHEFDSVKKVVFELSVRPDFGTVDMDELVELSEFFGDLPRNPEVVCGMAQNPEQETAIELRLVTV